MGRSGLNAAVVGSLFGESRFIEKPGASEDIRSFRQSSGGLEWSVDEAAHSLGIAMNIAHCVLRSWFAKNIVKHLDERNCMIL